MAILSERHTIVPEYELKRIETRNIKWLTPFTFPLSL